MADLKTYLLHLLIALDQFATALLGGFPDETLSSYAYRLWVQGKPAGVMRKVIDTAFFWTENHCENAYMAERKRLQFPPDLR